MTAPSLAPPPERRPAAPARRGALLLLACAPLAACGKRGALRLPDEDEGGDE